MNCLGTISGNFGLYKGLTVSDSGFVKISLLAIDNAISGMSGGSLAAASEYIGYDGTGIFEHSGGNNSIAIGQRIDLFLGYNPGANGT